MHIAIILSTLPLLQDGWEHRTLPSACRPTVPAQAPCELMDADHLPFPGRSPRAQEPAPAPIPVAVLMQLLDTSSGQGPSRPRLQVSGETLLVQGSPDAVRAVDATLSSLAALEEQLKIDWQVELTTGDGQSRSWDGSSRSGERVPLGERHVVSYLGSYDVNVTSDAGIATPETHRALLGTTAHLSFSTLKGGGHLIEGCLDVAQLIGLDDLDPETPDLGILQLPQVKTAQVRFAGIDKAVVTLDGPRVPHGGLKLVIRAGPARPSPGAGPWLIHDLAALTRPAPRPARIDAGDLGSQPGASRPRPSAAHDVGTLASLLDSGSLDGSPPLWAGSLLLLPRGSGLEAQAQELLVALEKELRPGTLHLSSDGLQATFTVIAGRETRLAVGVERRRACEVTSLLAPSIWMPVLQVERTFDGIVLEGRVSGGRLAGSLWETSSDELGGASEADNGVATLQRLERNQRGRSVDLPPSAESGSVVLPERDGVQAATLHFSLD